MEYFIFLSFEIIFLILIRNYFTILFFHHFPDKINFSIKEKNRKPFIKNKELNKLIKALEFEYIGIRKETIFKVFSLKYFLYKNKKNNYLDVTNNKKFYYISYFLYNKLNLIYKKTLQVTPLESDSIKISFLSKGDYNTEIGDDVAREDIGRNYYKNNVALLSLGMRIPIYLLITGYFIQLIWVTIKWLI